MGGGGDTDVEPTAEERELAQIATERFERFEQEFIPAENEFIESVQSIDEGDADLAAGTAAASSQQAFSQSQGQIAQSQIDSGAAPGSGRFNQAVGGAGDEAAASRGQAIAQARRGSTDRRLAGLEAVTAIGRGKDAESINTISDVAREANQESIRDAQIAANNRATNAQAAGTLVGGAASFADFSGGGGAQTPRPTTTGGGLQSSGGGQFSRTAIPSGGGLRRTRTPRPSGG